MRVCAWGWGSGSNRFWTFCEVPYKCGTSGKPEKKEIQRYKNYVNMSIFDGSMTIFPKKVDYKILPILAISSYFTSSAK